MAVARRSLVLIGLLVGCTEPAVAPVFDCCDSDPIAWEEATPEEVAERPYVVINEVQASNESTLQDDTLATPDWFELFNGSDEPVELSRMFLSDRSGAIWSEAEGAIEPGGVHLVIADGIDAPGHAPFLLAEDGDELVLVVDGLIVDRIATGFLQNDLSLARFSDGGSWAPTARPTPGNTNGPSPSDTLDPRDATMFHHERVHQIRVEITDENLELMDGSLWGAGGRTEVPCLLYIDGMIYPGAGIRLKGSASFRPMSGKPAFKIDFNEYAPGRRHRRLKMFNLHNGLVLDQTRVREHITYKLARGAGLCAPRVGWAEMWVNGDYYGVYTLAEAHDDEMMQVCFPAVGHLGALYEPDLASGGADFGTSTGLHKFELEDAPSPLPPEVNRTLRTLDQLVDPNASVVDDAELLQTWEVLDQETWLSYLAWEAVICHWDGYAAPNNWRFFVDPVEGRVHFVPSGAEYTWTRTCDAWTFSRGNVARYCMASDTCKRLYAERLLEVIELVDTLHLVEDFEEISRWIHPVLLQDPRSPFDAGDIDNGRDLTMSNLRRNPRTLRNQVYRAYPGLRP